jgi:hypothetical protein
MARPHPYGPIVALGEVGAVATLTLAVAGAAREYRSGHAGAAPWRAGIAAALVDADLRQAWEAASDGGRRDVMTTVAEAAARAGVDPAGLQPPDSVADREAYVAGRFAADLFDLAVEELAMPGRDPERSLLPEAPWEMALGPTGIYAMGVVCDSSEPEVAKVAATVALSAAAQQTEGGTR